MLLFSAVTTAVITGAHADIFAKFGLGGSHVGGGSTGSPDPNDPFGSKDPDSCPGSLACPTDDCWASATASHSGGVLTIPNCHNTGGSTEYIAWGVVDDFGDCGNCHDSVTSVPYGGGAVSVHLPAGDCAAGKDICVWVYDTSYSGGTTAPYIPAGCDNPSGNDCHVCGPYRITPSPPPGTACDDGLSCTVHDQCQADGSCAGTDDCGGSGCASKTCSPHDPHANVDGCVTTIDTTICDDGSSCTTDICVDDPNAPPVPPGAHPDVNGCVNVPGAPPPPTACRTGTGAASLQRSCM
eukprot:jgi/Ulvmu1/863/UM100_0014.1